MKNKNILIASVASLAVIATTAYLIIKRRQENKEKGVPAGAPQTPLRNPGEQSDFPASPSGELDLG